jgi:hypothetical protein
MNAFNKIGFYTANGRVPSGLLAWMRALDEAGIPFFLASDDTGSGLMEAQEIAGASQTPHTIVFRSPGGPAQPDYNQHPAAAAGRFWSAHKATLPAELNKALTWIEIMDDPRTDRPWDAWLGDFAFHLGQLTLKDGYRLAAFSFATNAPDPDLWNTAGMARFFMLCEENPGRLGIALRELSGDVRDIWYRREDHIGRFQRLYLACDRQRIARPPVLITRWGWTLDRIPGSANRALQDIETVGELYGRFSELLGAALWRLGDDETPIARQARRLIKPLTTFTLNKRFETAVELPIGGLEAIGAPEIFPMSPDLALAKGDNQANSRFILDVTIPDDTRLAAGSKFTKTWRVENNGRIAWGPGFHAAHVAGNAMGAKPSQPLPAANPGQQVDFSIEMTVPQKPGVHFSDWRFKDDLGNIFGDIVFTRIQAVPPPSPQPGVSNSVFVADVTIPDDMEIQPGQHFTKTWRVRNTGTRAWGPGFTIQLVGGIAMTGQTSRPLPAAAPGQEVNISIDMVALQRPGVHYGDWRLKDDQGQPFGELVYVRIKVPQPAGPTLTAPISQQDPLWANRRLGHAGSTKTIGEWGCLVACFAMTANALGEQTDPSRLNDAMLARGGYVNLYLTQWNALSQVYNHIVFDGRVPSAPEIPARIDASLAKGVPVPVHVDFTSATPYTENDQHWVLIVGRNGDDYRINDPWLYPPQEASLRERYGRDGQPLHDTILHAIFYRTTQPVTPSPVVTPPTRPAVPKLLQRGMNINPDAPNSNPVDSDDLKGLEWVRFVFKLAARPNPAERQNINAAFAQYDPMVRNYNQKGVKSLIIINQETVWGNAPWTGNNDWQTFAQQLAGAAGQVAARYQRYGANVAYQIWNEGDKRNNPASVFVEPENFAILLRETAAAIRAIAPEAPIIFNGMATGPEETVAYLKHCQAALGGRLPVDAVGVHPYTRWATKAPFDWGQHYGTLGDAFAIYKKAFPEMKFWITEIGVADDNEIGPQHYAEIANYFLDIYKHIQDRHVAQVPVVIWFAWSDWMRNAGIVRRDGAQKDHLFAAFRAMRNREL